MTVEEIEAYSELFSSVSPIIGAIFGFLTFKGDKKDSDNKPIGVSKLPTYIRVLFISLLIYASAGATTGWMLFLYGSNDGGIWESTNLVWVVANVSISVIVILYLIRISLKK